LKGNLEGLREITVIKKALVTMPIISEAEIVNKKVTSFQIGIPV
jgi:hypothetical protein